MIDGVSAAGRWYGGERGPEEQARRALIEACPTPADLAARLDASIVRTPAFDLVARRWAETIRARDGRLTISTPPQQLKTTITRWAIFWALLDDPDRRVVFASYGMGLARTSGRIIRSMVETYGAPYGLTVDLSHADAADWQLAGRLGGTLACGVGSSLTGRPADLLCCDDLLSGEQDAFSPAMRSKVEVWWESTARTRMAPGAPAVAIGTRWAEDDILSRFISEGWARINIPALADGVTLDSVADVPGARTGGGYLVSTRGTTPEDWDTIRRESGERAWHALMQGNPSPPEGGVFKGAWFDTHRLEVTPILDVTAVIVDPADTGQGDAAGILVMGRATDGRIVVLADLTAMLSQAQWGRKACLGWLSWNAARITQERNMGMRTTIPDAWAIIYRQSRALAAAPTNGHGDEDRVAGALAALSAAGDLAAADETGLRELLDCWGDVLERGPSGPRVVSITPKASKRVRAEQVSAAYETGRAVMVGRHRELEHECVVWTGPPQPSPNRLDTLAMGTAHLEASPGRATMSRPRATRVPSATVGPYRR